MLPRIQARNFLSGHRTFRIVMLFQSWKSFQQLIQNSILLPSGQKKGAIQAFPMVEAITLDVKTRTQINLIGHLSDQ